MPKSVDWEFELIKIPVCKWELDQIPDETSEIDVEHDLTINLKSEAGGILVRADATFETHFFLSGSENLCGNIKMTVAAQFRLLGIEFDHIKLNAVEFERFRKDVEMIVSGHARAHILSICQSAGIVSVVLPIFKS
jgi:hypothetical protein